MNNVEVHQGWEFPDSSVKPAIAGGESSGMPLVTRALSILRRRKWVIIGTVAASMLLGLIATLLMTPMYTASATFEIRRENTNLVQVGNGQAQAAVDPEYYQTQYGLLKANSLALRVAETLNLADNQKFFETFKAPVAQTWFGNGRPLPSVSTRADRLHAAGGILTANVSIKTEQLSRLVTVQFTSPDPALSKRVVDAWGRGFIEETLARRYEASSYARKFLEQRLEQLRQRIDEAERRLVDYAARNSIVNLPATTGANGTGGEAERSLAVDDLAALNRSLSEATVERVRAQARLAGGLATTPEMLDNGAINQLRQRRVELQSDYQKLLTQFRPEYPPAQAIANQIKQLTTSIAAEEGRVRSSFQDNYRAATARETTLREQVDRLKTGVFDLRRRSVQYNIYQRDADTNRQLYDALLQRYKEIGVAGGVGTNNISIVDPAELPGSPSSPKLALNMALALILGMVLGSGIALILEQLDRSVGNPEDVESELGISLLGTIPLAEGDAAQNINDQKSALSEAYFSVQTSLSFATSHGLPRTLAVTSSRPAEGKTTSSYALARGLARSRGRVLLVDGDMRSPSIHHLVSLPNDKGLSNYLAGAAPLSQLVHDAGYPNLSVMCAGPQPPSAAELLASDRISELFRDALTEFDHIIIDMPPVMGLADAPLIGSRVESTVFVVESHGTSRDMARAALDRLAGTNTRVLGVILTKFNPKKGGGYGYGYGYGYGDQDAQKP